MKDIKPTEKEFISEKKIDVLRSTIVNKLTLAGGKVTRQENNYIECSFGSNVLTRLWGGWFVSKSTLPRKADINFEKYGNKTKVRVLVREAIGIGLNIGMIKKYEEILKETADLIEELIK